MASTPCPYAEAGAKVLVADDTCAGGVCVVNSKCKVVDRFNDTFDTFSNLSAIGRFDKYTRTALTVEDSASVDLRLMELPPSVTSLTFSDIESLDLTRTKPLLTLTKVWMEYVSLKTLPATYVWPPKLFDLAITFSDLSRIPPNLPPSLGSLNLEMSNISSLQNLPPNVTLLGLRDNYLTEIVGHDWTSMALLDLARNPLHTFAFVKLSRALTMLYDPFLYLYGNHCVYRSSCEGCNLTNLTVSDSTFEVLKQLPQWDRNEDQPYGYMMDRSVHPDPVACRAIHGSIQMLWSIYKGTINACVVPEAAPSPSLAPSPPTNPNTDFRFGVYCGIGATLGVLLIVLGALLFWRRRRSHDDDLDDVPDSGADARTQSQPRRRRPQRALGQREAGPELDIAALRPYKLALHELTTVSQRPLGAGAFGEVWLGEHQNEQGCHDHGRVMQREMGRCGGALALE
ncbi:hypothetical protein SDRG_16661 [Saprolegnia diclina VS20]|uniref:Uncharacterized protein n=1 Tax=Saprolegnia diclina (strain VS20) TaxID=1156394 RepID=T0R7M4_SAPDV|nr:hypothetical protein SDRG_16661 [Saprolegnia diclina VS20]EQC25472.1 hypothetical protein SDRG_16661 [Saprolegnia diclina VS20]|eukprot:XP_008621100.1 hypothetical protein SDRG_16661 [Saprolegnia diclina VS20]